jgi:hypothetical protein
MTWHTLPLQIVLARGTPCDLVLDAPDGFTAVEGDAAAEVYDIVLGAKRLAQVSGFVMQFLWRYSTHACTAAEGHHFVLTSCHGRVQEGAKLWRTLC